MVCPLGVAVLLYLAVQDDGSAHTCGMQIHGLRKSHSDSIHTRKSYNEHITNPSLYYTCQCWPSSLPLVHCFHDNVTHTQARQVNMAAVEEKAWVSTDSEVMITIEYITYNYFLGAFKHSWIVLSRTVDGAGHVLALIKWPPSFRQYCLYFSYIIIIIFNEANRTKSGKERK